jgi:trehalose/maltose transport system substrate-binding protein
MYTHVAPRLAAFALTATASLAQAVTLTISCGSVGQDLDFCKKATQEWAARTGHTVNLFTQPQSTTDILALFRQMFAAKSADLDIVNVDVVWPGIIKDHLIDLRPYTGGAEKAHFPAIVANNTVEGRLIAMPWFTDAGMLYYRRDLLDKYGERMPNTWEDMARIAKRIQDAERKAGHTDMHGYIFQAKAYEGLSCNVLEWFSSYSAGSVVDDSGRISVNTPAAAKALRTAASWMGSISPQGVLNYGEEDVRGVFQNGNAVFMRNWPYAWALLNAKGSKVAYKVGVAALPKGGPEGRRAATLGGWQLAVSKYSKNPKEAAELVMYLSSREVQKERAIKGAFNPTLPELYKDVDVLYAAPYLATLHEVISNAVPRPSSVTGARYTEVSTALWNTAYNVLAGREVPEAGLQKLETKLQQVKREGW